MMPFSTRTRLERVGIAWPELELSLGRNRNRRWAGPLALDVGLHYKNKKERKRISGGSSVAALMPKSVLSLEENINCLEDGCSAYLSPMG